MRSELELRRAAAAHWRLRARVELEAAQHFEQLADLLRADGAESIAALCDKAAEDERRHRVRCEDLIAELSGEPLDVEDVVVSIEPPGLKGPEACLYLAVSIGCVAETLSVALLGEIEERATEPMVRAVAKEILRDEVTHSKIGWAYLARYQQTRDASWLGARLKNIFRAAEADEVTQAATCAEGTLEAYGVLSTERVGSITSEVLRSVVIPGLERFGVFPC